MGIKKRNKVSAEFSMSSLTDIIFLLLIFFMLTSSTIQVNIDLPKSDSKTVAPTDMAVMLTKDGRVTYNGRAARLNQIEKLIYKDLGYQTNVQNATVTIIAEVGVPWQKVNEIMTVASKLRIKAIIATQPNL